MLKTIATQTDRVNGYSRANNQDRSQKSSSLASELARLITKTRSRSKTPDPRECVSMDVLTNFFEDDDRSMIKASDSTNDASTTITTTDNDCEDECGYWDDDDDEDDLRVSSEERMKAEKEIASSRRVALGAFGIFPIALTRGANALTMQQAIAIDKQTTLIRMKGGFVNQDVSSLGYDALNDSRVFHNMATVDKEARGMRGLVPAGERTTDEVEILRAKKALESCSSEFEKYKVLVSLQNRDEKTFYKLLKEETERLLPILYTPTVGEACVRFGEILDRPRGLWISLNDQGDVEKLVKRWRTDDVKIAVITDGERILGLGDQGANGMGISVGKGMVYAASGIPPENILPVQIDTGTNNESHLKDPLYVGLRQNRDRTQKYDLLLEETIFAIRKRFGDDTIIHFEDFAPRNAFRILKKFQNIPGVVTYNDDIQGTAAVTVSGLIASTRVEDVLPLEHQRVLFFGAGQANTGAADLFVRALKSRGVSEEDAMKQVWLFDSKGVVTTSRNDFEDLSIEKKRFARKEDNSLFEASELLEAVQKCKPTALIGAAAQANAFSKPVLNEMAKLNKRPIVFSLSNPTSKSECTAKEAYENTNGRVVFASGTKFPVDAKTPQFKPGFANNAFIFPGIARGTLAAKATSVTPGMFLAAAERLAKEVTSNDLSVGAVFPSPTNLSQIASSVGASVAERAFREGVANRKPPFLSTVLH